MIRFLITIVFILIVKIGNTQTITFAADSTLNGFITEWVGRPYKLGGTTEKGIDCSQFNKRLYRDVYGINLENVCYKQWNETKRIFKTDLQVGDLLFFRCKASPSGWHCGVYIGETLFVHAANRYEGVKVSSLEDPRYKNTYRGAGRVIQQIENTTNGKN